MTSPAAPFSVRGLRLKLGEVSRVHVQVSYRELPEVPAHEQYLVDVSLPERYQPDGGFDEEPFLDALQPAVFLGGDIARHYSLHVHRWHTSWGASTGIYEIGLTVTTGPRTPESPSATQDAVRDAFRALLDLSPVPRARVDSRDEAVGRARRSVAAVHGFDAESLSLTSEQHDPDRDTWSVGLRAGSANEQYAVVVGFVDGFAGSVHLRATNREVIDSVGVE